MNRKKTDGGIGLARAQPMQVGARPEGPLEWIVQKLDLVPVPLADTHVAFVAARAIMAGTSLGIFDAIADGAESVDAIAAACRTDPTATRPLVDCLVALGYLRFTRGRYANARRVEKWLLARSPSSVRDKVLFQRIEWELLAKLEDFVRTGRGLDLHGSLGEESWRLYQDAMSALAHIAAPAIARRLSIPSGAERMLDIGGSHGRYSVALCRRHPNLRSEILELPAAVGGSHSPIELTGMRDRIRYRHGDVLRDEIGKDGYDVVLANNLVHHFSDAQNQKLARRVFRALRPGGIFVIGDLERSLAPRTGGALGSTMDLYFALVSTSGVWSLARMRRWQSMAGLVPCAVIRVPKMPGFVVQVGRKPKRSSTEAAVDSATTEPH
jgi:SAM-dependent methyltransferase